MDSAPFFLLQEFFVFLSLHVSPQTTMGRESEQAPKEIL